MGIPATESVVTMPLEEEAPRPRGKKDKDFHGRSPTQIALGRLRRDPVAVVCGVIVLLLVLLGVFADVINNALQIAGHQRGRVRPGQRRRRPTSTGSRSSGPPLGEFTWDHPLGIAPGTAYDNLARLLLGLRTSLLIATVATVISTIVGVVVGLLAGFSRGWLDRIISFVIDVFLSFPFLLGALTVAPILGRQVRRRTPTSSATRSSYSLIADPGDLRLDGPGPADPGPGAVAARAGVHPGRRR